MHRAFAFLARWSWPPAQLGADRAGECSDRAASRAQVPRRRQRDRLAGCGGVQFRRSSASGSASTIAQRIVTMLTDAGLDEFLGDAVYGNGLVPGVDPSTATSRTRAKPCDGAVQRAHSHFFTADGQFGSKDFNGQQVDDGRVSARRRRRRRHRRPAVPLHDRWRRADPRAPSGRHLRLHDEGVPVHAPRGC